MTQGTTVSGPGGSTHTISFSIPMNQPTAQGQGETQLPPLVSQLFGTAFGVPLTQVLPENGGNTMGLLHNLLGLPGNAGDYAFGRQMDDIISRLMDEGAMYVCKFLLFL
jgi:hypothetical protein